jgi:hypothetical protein
LLSPQRKPSWYRCMPNAVPRTSVYVSSKSDTFKTRSQQTGNDCEGQKAIK